MRNRTLDALTVLLPAGALGVSVALAAVRAEALPVSGQSAAAGAVGSDEGIAARLKAIRNGVSQIIGDQPDQQQNMVEGYPNVLKAWWGNGWRRGWRNGGWHPWRNGGWGWRNGGWAPWRNGWRNGGWRNWRNW
ncbi:GrrA/OscA1 family cyclophane-containing rSAM-modified RiPP [Methylocella silvestris]|uniref:RSAM-associated Gly-rich repeat protein n=1 Tax=Methylocella silvestris TaxID=199596 RepID=A0A2J7TE77_METSI|nr:GrrA/OscA1 family cyclophane-containing rSAM-modified RiPP [Methylocella silvestris]PNG25087.1 rSAM-associated Gly-rich repeat protein [Methylocella silvestris]